MIGISEPTPSPLEDDSQSRTQFWMPFALALLLLAGPVLKSADIGTLLGVDTTVFAMLLVIAAAVVVFLRHPSYPARAMLPLLIFALVVLAGVAASTTSDYQVLKTRNFFLIVGALIACIPILIRKTRDLRGLIYTWMIAGNVAAFATLIVGSSEVLGGRAGVGVATLGPAYLIAAGIVAAATAWAEGLVAWFIALPLVCISGAVLVTIGSRGPVIGTIAGLCAWVLARGAVRWRTVIVAFAFGGAVLWGLRIASSQALDRIFKYEDYDRTGLWANAWAAFQDHPLLGIGWGDFPQYSFIDQYPHNAFLEVAAELGLIGFCAFAAVLLIGAHRAWANRASPEVRILSALAVVALIGQMFSADLSNRLLYVAIIPTLLFTTILDNEKLSRAPAGLQGTVR